MKFLVRDEAGKKFEVNAPEGYNLQKVAEYATQKLGFKVKAVEHLDDAEERIKEAVARTKKEGQSVIDGHLATAKELQGRIKELEGKITMLEGKIQVEKDAHEATRRARYKDLGQAQMDVIESLRKTLADALAAREAAEERAAKAKNIVVENMIPEKPKTTWRIDVTARDAAGFVRSMEAKPS